MPPPVSAAFLRLTAAAARSNGSTLPKRRSGLQPTAGGGKLFVQTIDNTLLALDASSGREIWRYAAPSEETTLVGGAVPAYSENLDLLIAGFTNGELRALKANTGSPLWGDYLVSSRRTNSLDDINVIHVSPVIAGDTVFAAGSNNLLVAIDLRSGQRIWEREISTNNQPWAAGKYLYVLTEDARLLAVQSESGKIIWDTQIPAADDEQAGTRYAGPLLINNRLLVNASDGKTFLFPLTAEKSPVLSQTAKARHCRRWPLKNKSSLRPPMPISSLINKGTV